MAPLYPYSGFNFWSNVENNWTFLDSARSAIFLIASNFSDHIFLLPSYTCPTVWDALNKAGVEYHFIDIDDNLDFDISELNKSLDIYSDRKIVLIPTSLFGVRIRNYKELYPSLIILEDRAQHLINLSSIADFQVISFGRGKFVSGFGGGGVLDKYSRLPSLQYGLYVKNNFFNCYFLSIFQKVISRVWFIIEGTRLDPESSNILKLKTIKPYLMSKVKKRWILNTISSLDESHRVMISNFYLDNIKKEYLFNIERDVSYLRFPIKKSVNFTGVSKIREFYETLRLSSKEGRSNVNNAQKLTSASFLPTHNLVTMKYARRLVEKINE